MNGLIEAFKLDKPSEDLLKMRQVGWLYPEIDRLFGIPQPPQWHPEGCVGTHTMLTVDRAKELDATDAELFAALVHDLGKARTDCRPPKFQHLNHEALGVPLVMSFGARICVPPSWILLGVLAAKYHLHVHRYLEMRPCKRADLILTLQDQTASVALVAQADAQGRGPTMIDKPYPQRNALVCDYSQYYRSGISRDELTKLIRG